MVCLLLAGICFEQVAKATGTTDYREEVDTPVIV